MKKVGHSSNEVVTANSSAYVSQNGNNIEQNTTSNKNATITRRTIIIFQVKPENVKIFFYRHI